MDLIPNFLSRYFNAILKKLVLLELFWRFVKFKVTVTNDKKPPPYTTDIYMSDVAVSGNEFSLDGRKMQWICTQEREGVDRNDPNKAGFHEKYYLSIYKPAPTWKPY